MTSRHDELQEQAERFHVEHPQVWELFVQFTFNRIKLGFEHYSAYAVFERIRWETDEAKTDEDSFKLNNNYRPFYSRWFMAVHPEYKGFFRTRKQTSKMKQAVNLPEFQLHQVKESDYDE